MTADDKLIAIDVLLEPDRTMAAKSNLLNAQLRENYPAGYALDATHLPHVTLLQRFVRTKDFDAVTTAITKVLYSEHPTAIKLTTKGLDYVRFADLAVAVLVVERAPDLMRLHHKITDAVAPFSASGGTPAAFVGAEAVAGTVDWVETFVPKASGENYFPHITAGIATEPFLNDLKAKPFEPTAFWPDALAVFQLGNFGTAAKKLWEHHPDKSTPR
jgi:hypothetical protein